jgi:hypothetical protein
MRMCWALVSTEATKLKHTMALWLSVAVPTVVVGLELIDVLNSYFHSGPAMLASQSSATDAWKRSLYGSWTAWASVVAPILISVEAASQASLEHVGNQWKQLLGLPVPRWSILVAKLVLCGLLVGASFLLFALGALGLGLLRSALYDLHMSSAIPWKLVLRIAGRAYLACWAVMAIQMWLSMRFRGFAVPVGTGLAATMAGSFAIRLGFGGWWPWSMAADSLPSRWGHVPVSAAISPLFCLLMVILACWHFSRSEIF